MAFITTLFDGGKDNQTFVIPLIISLLGHALVFGLFAYTPRPASDRMFLPSLMNVHMVDLGGGGPSETAAAVGSSEASAPSPAEAAVPVAASPPAPAPREPAPAEVSLAPKPAQTKTALKYRTMRTPEAPPPRSDPPREERVAPRAAASPPVNPLEETIRRLREQVEREGPPGPAGAEGGGTGTGTGTGGRGGFGFGSRQEIEAIDLYRLEVAFTVQKNWAFAEQLAGGRGDQRASIVFKVMPDGRIEDIFFTDRSGNPHLDESAYRAIVKSSPVRPHPGELRRPYIEMGLRFTPKGVQ